MKKVILIVMSIMLAWVVNAQAQSKEDILTLTKLSEKIAELKSPKTCGVASIDGLVSDLSKAAAQSAEITSLLNNLFYRSIGETNEGVADASIEKPTLVECNALATRISEQTKTIAEATQKLGSVKDDVKGIKNPMTAAKAAKCVSYATDAASNLGEESVHQVKIIAEIIKTVSMPKN